MRKVKCENKDCSNYDLEIEVPDIGSLVYCGVCMSILAEEEPDKLEKFHKDLFEAQSIQETKD